jgi:16S rRNA (guanine527-N7)-methyltransferase
MDLIRQYFPDISPEQDRQFAMLQELYEYWNERINLISRKDIDKLEERHILHSLTIAQVIQFKPGTKILDVGTGGGFPGIPLAIMFPKARFTLVDSIGKKIKVVNEVIEALQLKNVTARQIRAEELDGKFDFVVSRAVTRMPEFLRWVRGKIRKKNFNSLNNGILYLKGGDVEEEMNSIKARYAIYDLDINFPTEFFHTKKLIYITLAR